MEKTDRELIREALSDHPRQVFWDGMRRVEKPMTARELFKMLGKEISDNDRPFQILQGQD